MEKLSMPIIKWHYKQDWSRIGSNEKVHMQTLCGLAHYDYKMLHAYSYEQAFQVMRQLRLPYGQAEQMFRRMVFNVIARN
ncbi:MAG: HipA domain-containing protein [Bacteroidales bacterium]|nr:HipA domain-containing protein [Bacteroidales bacterium]